MNGENACRRRLRSARERGKAWYSYHPLLHFPIGLGKLLGVGMPSTLPCFVFYTLSGHFLSLVTVRVSQQKGLIVS